MFTSPTIITSVRLVSYDEVEGQECDIALYHTEYRKHVLEIATFTILSF